MGTCALSHSLSASSSDTLSHALGIETLSADGSFAFLTFSCYRRLPKLGSAEARRCFEHALEDARRWYGFFVAAYVVMPGHVQLLIGEPERAPLAIALQMLKQTVSKRMPRKSQDEPFWQRRYFDENVYDSRHRFAVMEYIHRSPVKRNLCAQPEDWEWSCFRHHASGFDGVVRSSRNGQHDAASEWACYRN